MRTFLHFVRFLLRIDAPETQVTCAELSLLQRFAAGKDIVVELGCFEGRTTAALADVCAGTVFTVDPFVKGRLGVCYGELISRLHWRRLGLRNIQPIKQLSHYAVKSFHNKIDFLFIDADHTYEAIKRDWADWRPLVNTGGIIALHDCNIAPNSPAFIGTMKFYQEDVRAMTNVREVGAVDSLVVLEVS
jgi:predicted O-methyltransferase YrrM